MWDDMYYKFLDVWIWVEIKEYEFRRDLFSIQNILIPKRMFYETLLYFLKL